MSTPTDAYVQVLPDSTGAKIDASELLNNDGDTVERQRVNLSDSTDPNAHQTVAGERDRGSALTRDESTLKELQAIHTTLKSIENLLIAVVNP